MGRATIFGQDSPIGPTERHFHRELGILPILVRMLSLAAAQEQNGRFQKPTQNEHFYRLSCRAAFPFFHLQLDGFWSLVGTNGSNVSDPAIARAASALRNAVAFAKIDPDLYDLLRRPEWSCHLRSVIITSNFDPDVHARLVER